MTEHSDADDSRFRSNDYIPSESEKPLLRELLQEEMTKIKGCEEEMDKLRTDFGKNLKTLESRKHGFQQNVKAYRSALSRSARHRRVPTELWRLIFSYACHPYSFRVDCEAYYDDIGDLIEQMPALRISQVCSRWRQIMKSSPSLWSSVCAMFTELGYNTSKALQIHFTNAQDCLLDIRLVRVEDESYDGDPKHQAIWKIISQHLPRCRLLSLRLLHWKSEFVVDGLSFPHLECLQEEGPSVDRQQAFWQVIRKHAPRLTKAAIADIDAPLPFSQLTSLDLRTIRNTDLARLRGVLVTCTVLEELSVRGFGRRGQHVPPNITPILLSGSLWKFGIYDNLSPIDPDSKVLRTFLTNARMPSLTCFEIQCLGWPASLVDLARYSQLIERVKITIRSSGATADFNVSHPLFAFLRALPELKHVELHVGASGRSAKGDDYASSSRQFLDSTLSLLETERTFSKLEHLSIRLLSLVLDLEVVEKVFKAVQVLKRRSMPLKEFHLAVDPALAAGGVVKKNDTKKYLVELEPVLAERVRNLGIRVVFMDGTLDGEGEPDFYYDDEE
ncbi:hypothetical protein V5O48_010496 [Marasmius crinis-equi]|uniref:F-box domain-containing protein n=1 Tax=Marasmius crinis-equi TaxID=585013 RepID=A0ABR3F870_9AGAR